MEIRSDVTVVSCVWGDYAARYLDHWWAGIEALDPRPAAVVLSTDRPLDLPVVQIVSDHDGPWPYNVRWDEAIAAADTDWITVLGFDDQLVPDLFATLPSAEVADVWLIGYLSDQIGNHMPPANLDGPALLREHGNPTCYASPFTKRMWEKVGGFRDIAFSDWALLRDIALAGGRFAHSGKFGLRYNWHHGTSMSGVNAARIKENLNAARVTELRSDI